MSDRRLGLAAVALLATALGFSEPLHAEAPGESRIAVDLYYFGQRDPGDGSQTVEGTSRRGGNPLRAEGFDYGAGGLDLRFQVADNVALRGNGVVGWIKDEGEHPIPETVPDAVTGASPDLLTLDSQINVDWRPGGKDTQISPGFFYHHQKGFFSGGPNLDFAHTFAGGNSVVFGNTSLRAALIRQRRWTDERIPEDWRVSINALVGWTQYWSPSWLTTASLRYTRQSGQLHSRWNYVAVFDEFGRIALLVDENLPRRRHRGQLSLRARYSWAVGYSAGLDTSLYVDQWSILHTSAEASFEMPIFDGARLRLWYRFSAQDETKYFVRAPMQLNGYFTQDSDLGSFASHSPGLLVSVPLKRDELSWILRFSTYGFYRTDRVFAVGGHAGVAATW